MYDFYIHVIPNYSYEEIDSVKTEVLELLDIVNREKEQLKIYGWVNINDLDEPNKKKVFKQQFSLHSNSYHGCKEVDVNNLTISQFELLANGEGTLYQEVDLESVLPTETYNKYLAIKKKLDKQAKQKEANKKARLIKKKEQEIAKAKKLLENLQKESK